METDPSHLHRLALELDSEIGTAMPLPTGEVVVFSFDGLSSAGPHRETDVATLNRLRPHLARTGLIAVRLGVEQAIATTCTLKMFGLPGAVLSGSGRVIVTNDLFEELQDLFLPPAFGRLTIAATGANRLFQ